MIRSELIQKIADENPHLTQRHVERIVNTVFEEIIEALAKGPGFPGPFSYPPGAIGGHPCTPCLPC